MTIERFYLESDFPDNCTGNALCIHDSDHKLFGPCCGSPWNENQILITKGSNAFLELTGYEIVHPDDFLIHYDFKDIIGKILVCFQNTHIMNIAIII